MQNLVRREIVETAETVIVKIGTNVLTRDDESLDLDRIECIAEQIHRIHEAGRKVVLVSSGAVGAGMRLLGLSSRPTDLPHLQAAAATGQAHLIRLYDDCFRRHGYHAAQLLFTANDFRHRNRYLNVRNTLLTLFEYDTVPVVNENDTVSVDEIRFGDNDQLAAMLVNLLPSPVLIILSSVDGLFDGDPSKSGSRLIEQLTDWNDDLFRLTRFGTSSGGTGGMESKLQAVKSVVSVGESVILANGGTDRILDRIMDGESVGTLFPAQGNTIPAWKRWIGYTVTPTGAFTLDDGACTALSRQGRSLLSIGVTDVTGQFEAGAVVAMKDAAGNEFARGLSNYSSTECREIAGKRSEEIQELWGSLPYGELVHRNNLVVLT
jgi:glutamate 5-kinase